MRPDLNKIHRQIEKFMPAVNRLLVEKFSQPKKVSYKPGGVDHLGISVVTETDEQVEKILRTKLLKIFPGSGFIGEESGGQPQEYNWIVDPIDGTLNYSRQVPVFACSIGLWHKNQPVYGLVSVPVSGETIHAIKGSGVWLNGRRIKLTKRDPSKLFLSYTCVGGRKLQGRIFSALVNFTSSPRFYGSCVFQGAMIALGRMDGGVFINQAIWDIAAIVLFAQEAGLTVNYVSAPPRLERDQLKDYQYSLVIGPKQLAADIAATL